MKKKLLIILLILLFIITGCKKEKIIKKKELKKEDIQLAEKEYSLRLNETINIGNDINVSLYHVDDSRCPANTECYWQGELAYSLSINNENYKLSTVFNTKITYKNYTFTIVPDKCSSTFMVFKVEK